MNRSSIAVLLSSMYLLVFLVLLQLGYSSISWILFLLSPFLLVYLIYSIIRYGKYTGKELSEGEEWGYEDADRKKLGTWG